MKLKYIILRPVRQTHSRGKNLLYFMNICYMKTKASLTYPFLVRCIHEDEGVTDVSVSCTLYS